MLLKIMHDKVAQNYSNKPLVCILYHASVYNADVMIYNFNRYGFNEKTNAPLNCWYKPNTNHAEQLLTVLPVVDPRNSEKHL